MLVLLMVLKNWCGRLDVISGDDGWLGMRR